jgi:hypothetical protein
VNKGTALTLGFGIILVGGLLITSGVRDRSLSEVLAGQTSSNEAEAATGSSGASGGEAGTSPGGAPGGGTAGDQKVFGEYFAKYTGLNPAVVDKWLLAEQPAGSPSKPGSNNWLNIQYTDSGPNATYYAIAKLPPQQAAKASAEWLKGQSGLKGILLSAGKSASAQESAIVNSGWASSHYGGKL